MHRHIKPTVWIVLLVSAIVFDSVLVCRGVMGDNGPCGTVGSPGSDWASIGTGCLVTWQPDGPDYCTSTCNYSQGVLEKTSFWVINWPNTVIYADTGAFGSCVASNGVCGAPYCWPTLYAPYLDGFGDWEQVTEGNDIDPIGNCLLPCPVCTGFGAVGFNTEPPELCEPPPPPF